MRLNKRQLEKLGEMVEQMKELHELDEQLSCGEDIDMQDTVDSFIVASEKFLFELGSVNKKIF